VNLNSKVDEILGSDQSDLDVDDSSSEDEFTAKIKNNLNK